MLARYSLLISVLTIISASCNDNKVDPKTIVCNDLKACLPGTWTVNAQAINSSGILIGYGGDPGTVTFKEDMTASTTGNTMQGYLNGTYINTFTWSANQFQIVTAYPGITKTDTHSVISAYEGKIVMTLPITSGKLIYTFEK